MVRVRGRDRLRRRHRGGVEALRRKGRKSTPLLYARVGLAEFFSSDRRHPKVHVELPDGTTFDDVHFAIVSNTDPWTYAGSRPLRPTPQTDFDTGLGLYARRRMSAGGLLFSMARLSGSRSRIGRRGAHLVQDLPALTVRADEPLPVQVDGEYLGTRDKLTFSSTADALNVIV